MKQKNKHIINFWEKDSITYSDFDSKIFKKKIFSVTCKSLNENLLTKYMQKIEGKCFLNVKTLNFTNEIYNLKKSKIKLEDLKFVFFFKKKNRVENDASNFNFSTCRISNLDEKDKLRVWQIISEIKNQSRFFKSGLKKEAINIYKGWMMDEKFKNFFISKKDIILGHIQYLQKNKNVCINLIGMHPKYFNRGIGSIMINKFLEIIPFEYCYIITKYDNYRINSFLQKNKFDVAFPFIQFQIEI